MTEKMLTIHGEPIIFRIGKNAQSNFDLIDEASPEDFWFHVDEYPSPHVIMKIPNTFFADKKKKRACLKQGAVLCKSASHYASVPRMKICYTQVSNLIKGDKIGSVAFHCAAAVKYVDI